METTARLLALLSVLQRVPQMSGPSLADHLGVTVRTVRRDIDRLRQLGYVVDSEAGVSGGYRLGEGGSSVPPLMLDEEETVALAVCVRAAAGDSVAGIAEAAARALAKLEQSLPTSARSRLDALSAATIRLPAAGGEVDPSVLLTVTSACHRGEALVMSYRSANGRESERRLDPYRIVNAGRRWYLVARDRRHGEWRTFRLDRIAQVRSTGHGVDLRGAPDAAAFVGEAITTAPYRYRARVEFDAPLHELARRIPPTVGVLEAVAPTTTVLTTGADDLDLLVVHIGALGVPFRVLEPDALRDRVTAMAVHLSRSST